MPVPQDVKLARHAVDLDDDGHDTATPRHAHVSERFVAAGATPETLTLTFSPVYVVRVFVQGVRADPSDLTVVDVDVSVDTLAGEIVVIDYERAL